MDCGIFTSKTVLLFLSLVFCYFVAYPHQYRFIVDEPHRCRQETPFLVLMIPVAPHNRGARDVIRNTWGKETTVQGHLVSYYFLLGLSGAGDGSELLQESRRHHDLLQSDFMDSYNNLTIKTMVMFEWLNSHCPNTSYAMKVDTDMFLNVQNLVSMLVTAPRHLYMTGLVSRGAYVVRDNSSKWYLPVSAFPESTYPPFAQGPGYVFSMDLPIKILGASLQIRAVYIEDVYVGLCMRHLGLTLTDPPHIGLFRISMPFFPGTSPGTVIGSRRAWSAPLSQQSPGAKGLIPQLKRFKKVSESNWRKREMSPGEEGVGGMVKNETAQSLSLCNLLEMIRLRGAAGSGV
ncbi:beta-1,3-galactosyltransferase 2-like [Limanda limanda]|uniref:beta-1,3-galactosyltransferase 2-like n=1 Tax=Limanda limanda TaxID=27771 RepID=UPI0029C8B1A1|nr:beta-1,3-galactosyltransferase 2-like [Limanda limanda]